MGAGIGLGLKIGGGSIRNAVLDKFTDGVTSMTLGVIDGVLSLWYTDTDEVIKQWTKEE